MLKRIELCSFKIHCGEKSYFFVSKISRATWPVTTLLSINLFLCCYWVIIKLTANLSRFTKKRGGTCGAGQGSVFCCEQMYCCGEGREEQSVTESFMSFIWKVDYPLVLIITCFITRKKVIKCILFILFCN